MKKLILLGLMSAFADCSAIDAMRRFGALSHSLHERLPFGTNKLLSSASKVFEGEAYDRSDKLSVVCAFPDSEKNDIQIEQVRKDEESPIFLVMQQGVSSSSHLKTLPSLKDVLGKDYSRLKFVSVPDNIEEICDKCFRDCKSLSRVTFGENSSLKRIGKEGFMFSRLQEIRIPDSVEELCCSCFYDCRSLSIVRFGENSSLKRIGVEAFSGCGFRDIYIPAAVQDLGDFCFSECRNLIRVYFLDVMKLRHVGTCIFQGCNDDFELDSFYVWRISEQCFEEGGVRKFVGLKYGSPYFNDHLRGHGGPYGYVSVWVYDDTIERLDDKCFMQYISLESITFGDRSKLKFIGMLAFAGSGLKEIYIPDTVEEIEENCFSCCVDLVTVRFGEHSCLCKIGEGAFEYCSNLRELNLPDRVESIPDECFFDCNQLDITFGCQSRLRNIGIGAFAKEPSNDPLNGLRAIYIPDGVEELGSECFLYSSCTSIIFGENSALKMAGVDWCITGANVVYPQKLRDVIRANLYSKFDYWEMPTFQTIEPINKIQVVFIYYDSDDQERTILLALENETTLSLYDLDQETAMQVVEVIIPPNTEIIDYGCFFKCAKLQKITFADGSLLKLIRSGAFGGTKLTEITIPDSVEELGGGCFQGCNNLSVVRFAGDSRLKSIGCQAFMKSGLREIQIPDSVEEICDGCFVGCRNLSCITFGEASNLQRIGQKVFDDSGLTKVCAPKNVQDLIRQVLVGTKLDGKVNFIDPQQASKTNPDQQ